MSATDDILRYFSSDQIVAICEEVLDPLREQIIFNLQTKTSNSGKRVNSLDLPADTSGDTAASLQTIAEQNDIGLIVSFVGRKGIRSIDKGTSPAEAREEHGSVENLYHALKPWARQKEAKYGLDRNSINAWFVAQNIWAKGSALYQDGGGTETIGDLLAPAIEAISKKFGDYVSISIYELLDQHIEL